ncbi:MULTISPECIES: FAD-dependent monooxygenase [unclassified Rhizobium]|uniref:FAD-dependent monooxygenase n=1 Tax=unclassified Rhizobium TaxID=2613769 RepID=UPI000714DFDF|nr:MULTISPECIES: FAD-dependent monooxygenase [unclassified Rhizobium]KQS83770.1 FAD-dependent oxidoreductase [Rhizobium sp. Leaf386]KQT04907.1 FAD-dependent oxidoreductase [Rhizobium sp. Leaf391]KQU08710.1 FAD-dependent oxidoreductase [Rhizobium sp. Leaf453]
MAEADVLVVGAGPTGLVMALWLNGQGIKVRIIDKSEGPGETSRAMVVHARTLELYRQLGIGDAVADAGRKSTGIKMWAGRRPRANISFGDAGEDITPYPFVLVYPQDLHERFLVEQLRKSGIEVERRTELVDFTDDGSIVTARLRGPDGQVETCETRYLAGCDGARSVVRKTLGASFEGGTYDQLFYVADVEAESDKTDGEVTIVFEGPEFMLLLPYGTDKTRLIGTIREDRIDRDKALTIEDVGREAISAIGLVINKVNWFSTYRVHHRITERFRHGRVFLLGDAAHVHSPAGGQGMNTGIGDAINLAWKLAAVLKGQADDSLLDSFELERPVFARKLVETTDRVFSAVTAQGSIAEFMRTRVAPIFAKVAWSLDPAREAIFRLVSQTTLDYPESPLSVGKAGKVEGGDRLPFVRFDGRDNYDSLSAIAWQVHVYGAASAELKAACADHNIQLHAFEWREEFGDAGLARDAIYLLRPDTYVGLADPLGSADRLNGYLAERAIRPA